MQKALNHSSTFESPEIMQALIDSGVDINAGGIPPIHLALYFRMESAFSFLSSAGADMSVKHHGQSLMLCALLDNEISEDWLTRIVRYNWELCDVNLSDLSETRQAVVARERKIFNRELVAQVDKVIKVRNLAILVISYF